MPTWKPIPGWEHRYEVSDQGEVRSKDMRVCAGRGRGGYAIRKGRVLKPIAKSGRYLCVTLAGEKRREQWFIHDLVALAFIGPKPQGLEVLHRDDEKRNNSLANIRYGTKTENEADRQANGKVRRGEDHGCARLTESQVRAIRAAAKCDAGLAQAYGVSVAHLWAIRVRRVWRHI